MWRSLLALGLSGTPAIAGTFPIPTGEYGDAHLLSLAGKLSHRIAVDPFNLVATGLFLAAIIHTFLAARFTALAHRYQHRYEALNPDSEGAEAERERLKFRSQIFHLLGEVEAIFGIWLIPLLAWMAFSKGVPTMVDYVDRAHFAEPIFVGVIMAISASRPILALAESFLRRVAALGRGTPAAWWLAILTLGPLLGSFITEPAAMTICALLLGAQFYACNPGEPLKYATLGLLFVNISVGGLLTPFAAPPVVMVAGKWGWDLAFMISHFGWKVCIGILAANALYYLAFQKQLRALAPARDASLPRPVPLWITLIHLALMVWTVLTAHHPALVGLGFLFFLAFTQVTGRHQSAISLRSPLLVCFFLASLVLHGSGQQWWIAPVLGGLGEWPLMLGATVLTAFNDNAAITYLATLVPNLTDALKYAVVAGAVAGGGLTVIANAPNPAGQSILSRYFANGVSPLRLFLAALAPTGIMIAVLMGLR